MTRSHGRPNNSPPGTPRTPPRVVGAQTEIGKINMKLQNVIHILIAIVCVGVLPNARPLAAQSRRVDVASQHEQTTGQSGYGLPANIIVVTNTNDSGSGSLRQALAVANDGDTIDATGVSGTIFLTTGELQVTHNVTINGPGAGNLAVNGNATYRGFENFASNVAISGFTITNCVALGSLNNGGGGILNHGGLILSDSIIISNTAFNPVGGGVGDGGGIYSEGYGGRSGTLTVTNSTISNNVCAGLGGGIAANAAADGVTVTVSNCTISGNTAIHPGGGVGGGIAMNGNGVSPTTLTVTNSVISGNHSSVGGGIVASGATATVSNSTIKDNIGDTQGGGISAGYATVTVSDSTISGNSSMASGGGIYSEGSSIGSPTLTVTNSTISGNSALVRGGGIFNGGFYNVTLTVTASTFSGNSAGTGGSVWNEKAAQIANTILNAGASGGTIVNIGTFNSLGYNLATDNGGGVLTGPSDQIFAHPNLGPLQDNGGPTFTHALLYASPAINAGDPSFTPPPSYDQRGPGFDRVRNGRIDIGSFEVQEAAPTPTPTATATPSGTPRPSPTPRHISPRPRPTPAPR